MNIVKSLPSHRIPVNLALPSAAGNLMPQRRARCSLQDIANEAGVTVSTVSRILSKQTKGFSVKPEKRAAVLEAVQRLNYRPNILAQSLRKERMSIVGLLSVQPALGYTQSLINGLMKVLEPKKVSLCSTYSSLPHPIQCLPPWRIDGAVVISSISVEETDELERGGVPYVCVNGVGGPNAMMVSLDDAGGTRQAMEYLIRLGHKRIVYANVGGPYKTHISVAIRRRAYLDVIAEAGLSPVPMHDSVLHDPPDEFVRAAVFEHRATAIVCYHSVQAITLLKSMQKLGIRTPAHVSLLALSGGYPLAELFPSITSVDLPFDLAGEIAANQLFESFSNPKVKPGAVTLPEKLSIRQSTGPPPSEI